MLKENVGRIDGWVRIIAGLVVITIGLILGSWWGLVGFVLILTAVAGRCPIYSLVGFSSVQRRGDHTVM